MSASDEYIKLTAVPSGVDSTNEKFYLSVVVSPDLVGGDGTLGGTDFENWPLRLETFQNDNGTYGPAYWDVVLSDSGGNVLFEYLSFLQTSTTDENLWRSIFPSTTTFESADSGQVRWTRTGRRAAPRPDDRYRGVPIISYPATPIADFVLGQYQQYSPTEVPDVQTVAAVYAPVTEGLFGVVGEAQRAAQARERQANSRGGTVPHSNDFTDATTSEAYAAFKYYQTAQAATSANPPQAPGTGTIDFHAALTYIAQHGVLHRALGLTFDLEIDYSQASTAVKNLFTGTGADLNSVFLSVSLYSQADSDHSSPGTHRAGGITPNTGRFAFTQVSPRTTCDANSTTFCASSITGSIVNGLRDGSNPEDLKPVPISIIGDVNSTSNLVRELKLRQAAEAKRGDYDNNDFIPYGNLKFPPPSLRSGTLTVAQVGNGFSTAVQMTRGYLAGDAAANAIDSGESTLMDFAAEDLVRGYVLDVLDTKNNVWRSTGERLVSYTSGSYGVSGSTSAPFDEAAVQAPPNIVYPPGVDSEQFTLSEIILSYNGWSNAAPRPGAALNDSDNLLGPGTPPFPLSISQTVPPGRLPPLRFGRTYRLRIRVIDLANNKHDVSDPAINRNYTDEIAYGRLEPVPSPDVYPQSVPRPGESTKRLVIRDLDKANPSVRALYPQRVSEQFAEAHGMFDNAQGDPDPNAYATIVPRESTQYPDPPLDATQPVTIDPNTPVPFLPDPLARGAGLKFRDIDLAVIGTASIDFSPQNGGSWPDYRPFTLQVVAGDAFGTSVDPNARVLTITLSPADDVSADLYATCDPGDVALLATPRLFKGTPDPTSVAAGQYWAATPADSLNLVYAVQKPLATPELQQLSSLRSPGATAASVYGSLAWSPKSTSEVDIVGAWSEPVDDPATGQLQGPGAPNQSPRETSGAPVATVREGNLQQAGYPSQVTPDDDALTATDPLSFNHEFLDTKHRVVTYSAVASSRFGEYYPDGTEVSVSGSPSAPVNILSSARPEAPQITDVVPIYQWELETVGSKLISDREPSALRVFIARPWWSSGDGELLGVLLSAADDTNDTFTINPEDGVSDWAADPVFASQALPSRHPRQVSFPSAVRRDRVGGVEVAGHPVAFDIERNTWYCDIKVDTGAAYTPMIRLALARWQPDSVSGMALSNVVMTQIMTLDPGRTLTIVRRHANALSSVQLTGYSYRQGAKVAGPGVAQLQVEQRDKSIDDEVLGWQLVGAPITMRPSRSSAQPATWTARDIRLPSSGPRRIVVTQYENLPGGPDAITPPRAGDPRYKSPAPGHEYRLVHQDVVEV